jgi:hypothetical protein
VPSSSPSPAVAVDKSWVAQAACLGADPEAWFIVDPASVERAQAIQICTGCRVRAKCLAAARKRRERHGIWGGVDFTK